VTFNSSYLRGPGSAVQYITVHEYGAMNCNGCHVTAKKMDQNGSEWCLLNIDTLAQEMHENAQTQRWNRLLDFVVYSLYGLDKYKELIRRGVNEHIVETVRKRGMTGS